MGARVLVAEDHQDTRELFADVLRDAGYLVDAAADGLDAMALFTPGRYACIVADHYMPGLTGLEMAASLRAMEPTLPVVLITGASEVINHPPHGLLVLVKPIGIDLLVAMVRESIRYRPELV